MSAWLTGFLLALAPLLILVALLIGGRYPGEEAIVTARRALTHLLAPSPARAAVPTEVLAHVLPPRGGRLIARSLAGRGPPVTAV